MKSILKLLPFGVAMLPVFVFADSSFDGQWFEDVAETLGAVVGALVPIFIALAFLVFVWGLITFILASGDEDAKAEGKRRMIWGVVALFVIISIWGIIALLQQITGTDDVEGEYPEWPTTSGS